MESQLANVYSADFNQTEENFLKLKEVDEKIEELPETLSLWFGNVLIKNPNNFLFVPFIYNGNVYEYSKTSEGWTKTNTYKGLNQQKPYSFLEGVNERKPDAVLSSIRFSERRPYIIHNWSKGIFEYNDFIFNFTFSDIKDKRVFGVEVYDDNLNLVGYSPIKSIPITNEDDNFLSWFVEDVDEEGNFYFLQRDDNGSKIRVMQIDQQDLENL